jgi:hypothetical protein
VTAEIDGGSRARFSGGGAGAQRLGFRGKRAGAWRRCPLYRSENSFLACGPSRGAEQHATGVQSDLELEFGSVRHGAAAEGMTGGSQPSVATDGERHRGLRWATRLAGLRLAFEARREKGMNKRKKDLAIF